MDPLAHTLFGASMAEAGLKRKTALATATLIIGANIPDVDAVAMLIDQLRITPCLCGAAGPTASWRSWSGRSC
jgi:hypothetical protein